MLLELEETWTNTIVGMEITEHRMGFIEDRPSGDGPSEYVGGGYGYDISTGCLHHFGRTNPEGNYVNDFPYFYEFEK